MKLKIFLSALLALAQYGYGQGSIGIDNSANQLASAIDQMHIGKRQIVSTYVKNPPKKILGSYYVFEDWENKAIVQVLDDKPYRINNVNVNVREDRFEAKFGKDSIFAFDAPSVDYFLINDRKFKKIYLSEFQQKRICEVLVEDEEFTILKTYRSDIKKNDPDPLMLKPEGDEFVIISNYYLKRGTGLEKFKLNKKSILALFSPKTESVEEYVKEEKLSYKKSGHLRKIYSKWKTALN